MRGTLRGTGAVAGLAALSLLALTASRASAQQAGSLEISRATAATVGEQMVRGFSQESPFDPDAPDHLWLDNGDGTYLFLHFDKPLPEATKIIYTGWAVKGRWCAEDQPRGFTHFHRTAKVAKWDAGHGGSKAGEEGYWLKHVAVESFQMPEMMGMPARVVQPGLDREFMPTQPPGCKAA